MNWHVGCLKKYATFSGRARRTEYWMFFLFNFLASVVAAVIDAMLGLGFVQPLYCLAVLIPGLAVTVRRLHDTDRSGLWCLIAFVPIVGAIWLLVLMCLDSKPGENRFGANPKA